MHRPALSLIGLASLLACADPAPGDDEVASTTDATTTTESDDDASTSTADGDATTTDDGDTTSSGDGDGDTTDDSDTTDASDTTDDGFESFPACTSICSSAADCAQPLPAYDEDNWECTDGGCVWLGCKEGECEGNDVCRDTVGVPNCLSSCLFAADCDLGIGPYVEANYDCTDGACVFTGCSSDAECAVFNNQVCVEELALPVCLESCETPDDCGTGQPAFDADNYTCENQHCVYQGCMQGECADGQICI